MQTLPEAGFDVARQLMQIAATEGRLPRVIGIYSIERIDDGQASIWLDLDDAEANEGMGIVICHVDAHAVSGMDRADILRALMAVGTKH